MPEKIAGKLFGPKF